MPLPLEFCPDALWPTGELGTEEHWTVGSPRVRRLLGGRLNMYPTHRELGAGCPWGRFMVTEASVSVLSGQWAR